MNRRDDKKMDSFCMKAEIFHRMKRMAEDGVRLNIIMRHTDLPEEVIRNFISNNLENKMRLCR